MALCIILPPKETNMVATKVKYKCLSCGHKFTQFKGGIICSPIVDRIVNKVECPKCGGKLCIIWL